MDPAENCAAVKDSKFFAICADEIADATSKEQLSLITRFTNEDELTSEEFIEFVLCDTGSTGQAIADKIKSSLEALGLDLKDKDKMGLLVWQSFCMTSPKQPKCSHIVLKMMFHAS